MLGRGTLESSEDVLSQAVGLIHTTMRVLISFQWLTLVLLVPENLLEIEQIGGGNSHGRFGNDDGSRAAGGCVPRVDPLIREGGPLWLVPVAHGALVNPAWAPCIVVVTSMGPLKLSESVFGGPLTLVGWL